MKSTLKLFKAIPVESKKESNLNETLLKETIKRGFIFSPTILGNYSEKQLRAMVPIIEQEIGLTAEKMNSSFHKSWEKVRDADIIQLIIEQVCHYITTYGYEMLGVYNENTVYIPNEALDIPNINLNQISLVVIKGYTKRELRDKLLKFLNSGIALNEDTKQDMIDVAVFVDINERDIKQINNKEVKIALYDYFDIVPEEPVEFLRYLVYKSTNQTLLIKNRSLIEEIKSKDNLIILNLIEKYKVRYGLKRLAEIFYRFKPIFLAFRKNSRLKKHINKIRKLAYKYHKPLKEDYLNTVTSKIKNNEVIDTNILNKELNKVNIFRKIRLAYALKYRTKDVDSILYKVRNGKSYSTDFAFNNKTHAKFVLDIILNSIAEDIKNNVKEKKIYIPKNINYALPSTEKQFSGYFPSGTYISIPKDMIVGVHWENVGYHRIDLDLALISPSTGKMGWDGRYRNSERSILFSGDITDAPNPEGASELFYVKKQTENALIMTLNYFNYTSDIEVPFKIIVAKKELNSIPNNYMVDPNNVITVVKTKIDTPQKLLGLLITTPNECRFYFVETNIGKCITSYGNKYIENSRKYLFNYYENSINFKEILTKAGAILVDNKEEVDIDLSPEALEKDTLLNILTK